MLAPRAVLTTGVREAGTLQRADLAFDLTYLSNRFADAAGLIVIALGDGFGVWAVGSAMFGAGTAMAYPTLIAAVGDVAHPTWRGAAVGVYRLWRDIGFAVGAVLSGVMADLYSLSTAIVVVAIITALSGLDVALRMRETLEREPLVRFAPHEREREVRLPRGEPAAGKVRHAQQDALSYQQHRHRGDQRAAATLRVRPQMLVKKENASVVIVRNQCVYCRRLAHSAT